MELFLFLFLIFQQPYEEGKGLSHFADEETEGQAKFKLLAHF